MAKLSNIYILTNTNGVIWMSEQFVARGPRFRRARAECNRGRRRSV